MATTNENFDEKWQFWDFASCWWHLQMVTDCLRAKIFSLMWYKSDNYVDEWPNHCSCAWNYFFFTRCGAAFWSVCIVSFQSCSQRTWAREQQAGCKRRASIIQGSLIISSCLHMQVYAHTQPIISLQWKTDAEGLYAPVLVRSIERRLALFTTAWSVS